MTFRARLTLFFLGIVAVPLLAGAFLADHLSRSQAVRDADARLEVASVAAADGFRQERIAVGHALSSTVAVRAFRAARLADLDRLRRASRLDYLLVMRRGRPTRASIDVPRPVPRDPRAIARGVLRFVAAERRVIMPGTAGSSVLGGRLWRPELPSALQVRSALVVAGHPAGGASGSSSPSRQPVSIGDMRMVCLCRAAPGVTGLALSTSIGAEGVSAWLHWPRVGLLVLAVATLAGLAYVLAGLLSRPLRRLAEDVTAVARGDTRIEPAVDPAAGPEMNQVAQGVQIVSAKLRGSRDELQRTRGRLAAAERLTLTDPLTEVWNRRYLQGALREQTKRFARFEQQFALLLIDIDRFKRVNDAHGHVVGDTILRGVARTIGSSIRSDIDVLARLGGDEFAAVLPESDEGGAPAAAEKIRTLVAASSFEADGLRVSITVSVGVAVCPRDGLEPERILAAADEALYRAKAAGRNRISSGSPEEFPPDR